MIDVSSFTHLPARVALLVERRGEAGICEETLFPEANAHRSAVNRELRMMVENGLLVKVTTNLTRYYSHETCALAHTGAPCDNIECHWIVTYQGFTTILIFGIFSGRGSQELLKCNSI